MIYADHAATTPLLPCARKAMEPYLTDGFANPSAQYRAGLQARRGLELARWSIADCLGCAPEEIYMTSGGSEGNSWAVWNGALLARRGGILVTSPAEHHSVLRACEGMGALGVRTAFLPVDSACRVRPDGLRALLADRPGLVSVQYANNELGTVQDIPALAAICREAGVLFHTDAVQAVGHIPVSLENTDLLTASAHKFGGPKGIGFLYARRGTPVRPLIYGGSQERGLRGGTEDPAAAAGMAAALSWSVEHREENAAASRAMAEEFRAVLRAGCPNVVFHGSEAETLPGLVSAAIPGQRAERLVYRLDCAGLCVSAGAACDQSGERELSHVLTAAGIPEELAACTIRFSFGGSNRVGDGRAAAELLLRVLRENA